MTADPTPGLHQPAPPSGLHQFERSHLVRSGAQAALTVAFMLAVYFVVPVAHRQHESELLRLSVALAVFVAVLVNEIRLVSTHRQPLLRAAVALATVIPLFLLLFSWIYLTLSTTDHSAFIGAPRPLDRPSALYFTVSVFSTVGFGDIAPATSVSRMVVTVQMLADLALLAVVVRLIFGAASRGAAQQRTSDR